MTNYRSSHDLAKEIERVVREHIAASQKVAKATIERVFTEMLGESARPSQPNEADKAAGPAADIGGSGGARRAVLCRCM